MMILFQLELRSASHQTAQHVNIALQHLLVNSVTETSGLMSRLMLSSRITRTTSSTQIIIEINLKRRGYEVASRLKNLN